MTKANTQVCHWHTDTGCFLLQTLRMTVLQSCAHKVTSWAFFCFVEQKDTPVGLTNARAIQFLDHAFLNFLVVWFLCCSCFVWLPLSAVKTLKIVLKALRQAVPSCLDWSHRALELLREHCLTFCAHVSAFLFLAGIWPLRGTQITKLSENLITVLCAFAQSLSHVRDSSPVWDVANIRTTLVNWFVVETESQNSNPSHPWIYWQNFGENFELQLMSGLQDATTRQLCELYLQVGTSTALCCVRRHRAASEPLIPEWISFCSCAVIRFPRRDTFSMVIWNFDFPQWSTKQIWSECTRSVLSESAGLAEFVFPTKYGK